MIITFKAEIIIPQILLPLNILSVLQRSLSFQQESLIFKDFFPGKLTSYHLSLWSHFPRDYKIPSFMCFWVFYKKIYFLGICINFSF